jgi:hypothetical protein
VDGLKRHMSSAFDLKVSLPFPNPWLRRDPALWTHEKAAQWLEGVAADPTAGSQAAEMRSLPSAVTAQIGGGAWDQGGRRELAG